MKDFLYKLFLVFSVTLFIGSIILFFTSILLGVWGIIATKLACQLCITSVVAFLISYISYKLDTD